MKIKFLKWYQYIVIFVLLSVAFFIYNYLGIPLDVFKETSSVDVLSSEIVQINGITMEDNKCIIDSDQNSIVIEGDQYRTIVMNIESMSSENVSCKVNENTNTVDVTINLDFDKMTSEELEKYGYSEENTRYEVFKSDVEKEGYTCK